MKSLGPFKIEKMDYEPIQIGNKPNIFCPGIELSVFVNNKWELFILNEKELELWENEYIPTECLLILSKNGKYLFYILNNWKHKNKAKKIVWESRYA